MTGNVSRSFPNPDTQEVVRKALDPPVKWGMTDIPNVIEKPIPDWGDGKHAQGLGEIGSKFPSDLAKYIRFKGSVHKST